ncbi:GNAT family N-acetyltransferase [Pseudomonas chlororaphis]|uniref:GNAT family N-acetyltransferase n=1 Tax=Pseudomonas chlororaphis TaxID=587753 RepID=UPI0023676CB3|nr:GNAT family N-acetyltransferase [Pseudomonas chlororaphis]WDH51189.1 GNAT family N-acetyltransferase [Pseudomonas chlororaphis]
MLKLIEIRALVKLKNETLCKRLQKGQSSKTRQFIAVLEDVEVGLLIYENWGRPEGFIYEIFVLQANRKSGIGTWILSQAELFAAQLGHTSVKLTARSLFQDELSDENLTEWYESKGYVRSTVERGVLEKVILHQNIGMENLNGKGTSQS